MKEQCGPNLSLPCFAVGMVETISNRRETGEWVQVCGRTRVDSVHLTLDAAHEAALACEGTKVICEARLVLGEAVALIPSARRGGN